MTSIIRRWQTAVGILTILLLASGCFTNVGDEANAPAISLQITATNTPTEEPSPTEEPEETIEAEAQDAVDLPIAENPTQTETPTATATATEGITEVAQLGDLGEALMTNTPDIDPFSLTATSIIATATAGVLMPTWAAETQTAQAILVNPLATATTDLGLFPATATSVGVVPSGADCVHEVRTGDTLFRMSVNYGIPVMDIASRNGITNPDIISVGQMLVINGCGTTGIFPPATSIPTEVFGSGGPALDGSTGTTGGGGCVSQYTVNQYDTLFQISMQYGVSVQSIANANGIANINIIDMGSVLCIPAQ